MRDKYWKNYALAELTTEEWEALCDGCGKCCTVKLEGEDGDIVDTCISCKLFDSETSRCSDYANRAKKVPECVVLTPQLLSTNGLEVLQWMPNSCAYRRLAEGKPLQAWHHLVCGDREQIHREGRSVRGKVVSEESVHPDDFEQFIVIE